MSFDEYVIERKTREITPAMNALQEAAIALLAKKEVYEIEVTELCKRANVSRNTFYAYYDSIDDVIAERADMLLVELCRINVGVVDVENQLPEDFAFFKETTAYVLSHKEEFLTLTTIRPNHRFISKWKDSIAHHLHERKRLSGKTVTEIELEIASSATISGLIYYASHSDRVSLDFMCSMISKALNIF